MQNIGLILLVFAFVMSCVAIFIGSIGRANVLAIAIAFWIASELLGGLGRVVH